MKFAPVFFTIAVVASLGAGCGTSGARSSVGGMPTLVIQSPKNNVRMSSNTTNIVGKTNVQYLLVNNEPLPVENGTFNVPIVLLPGANIVTVAAGNGFSTTTQALTIQRTITRP